MLIELTPKKSADVAILDIDRRLQPLFAAAASGLPLEPAMVSIIRRFGFDSFLYGLTTDPRPNGETRTYYWTTLAREWPARYAQNNYLEVDPRISVTGGRTSPLLWDAATMRGPPRVRAFLDDAGRYGIRSGVVVTVSDGSDARIGIMFNSAVSPVSPARNASIMRRLGTLMVFAARFHDHFMARQLNRILPANRSGSTLSTRERQCLQLAARGMTSPDIGFKLGITERTANFHFGNIISKLGVLNRQEAIAKAISQGTIRLEP